MMLLTSQNRRL